MQRAQRSKLLGCLKSTRLEHGRLINFGSYKFEIKKYVRTDRPTHSLAAGVSALLVSFFALFVFFCGEEPRSSATCA